MEIAINDTIEVMGHSLLILICLVLLAVGFTAYSIIKDRSDLTKKLKNLNKD